jgi:hypothetical protein
VFCSKLECLSFAIRFFIKLECLFTATLSFLLCIKLECLYLARLPFMLSIKLERLSLGSLFYLVCILMQGHHRKVSSFKITKILADDTPAYFGGGATPATEKSFRTSVVCCDVVDKLFCRWLYRMRRFSLTSHLHKSFQLERSNSKNILRTSYDPSFGMGALLLGHHFRTFKVGCLLLWRPLI